MHHHSHVVMGFCYFLITVTARKGNESVFNLIDFYRNKSGVLLSAYALEHLKEK